MTRKYELALVLDPRVSDEDSVALIDDYKAMLTSGGATITKEENWGKRKLAYPINKLNEGRYTFIYMDVDGKSPIPDVELRLRQNDKVLRFLTIRTDPDLKRQERKGRNLSPTSSAYLEQKAAEDAAAEAGDKEE